MLRKIIFGWRGPYCGLIDPRNKGAGARHRILRSPQLLGDTTLPGNGRFHLLHGLGHVSCKVHKPEVVNGKIREIIAAEGMAP